MKPIITTCLSTLALFLPLTTTATAQDLSSTIPPITTPATPANNIARDQRLYVTPESALTIQFQNNQSYTFLMTLERPIANHTGEILVPPGADVEVTLTLTEDGAQLTAHYILIEGMEIPIQAHSHPIPIQERVVRSTQEKVSTFVPYSRTIGYGVGTLAFDDPQAGEMVGTLLPIIASLFIDPDMEKGAYLPEHSLALRISTPIEVPDYVLQALQIKPPIQATTSPVLSLSATDLQDDNFDHNEQPTQNL